MRLPRPCVARRPAPGPRRTAVTSTALVLGLALAATACSESDAENVAAPGVETAEPGSGAPADGGAPATADTDVEEEPYDPFEDAPAEACPTSFTEGRSGDAATFDPSQLTTDAPTWVCRYEPGDHDAAWQEWKLAAVPVRVRPDDRELVRAFAEGLTPADPKEVCRADLDTRLLVAHETRDGEQAHAVIDEFGCGHVRLAENLAVDVLAFSAPSWSSAPGTARALSSLVNQE